MKHLLIILLALIFTNLAQSQSSEGMLVGEWKTHFAFNQVFEVIETPDRIIGATRLGLIVVEKSDFSIHTLTKVQGLSDYFITALSYSADNSSVLIGYENGNIDVIKNDDIININDLKIKQLVGSKAINHFLVIGEETYVATDFGIIVLNIDKREISSTFYIGENATNLIINQLAIDESYLYAATASGVRRILKDAPNMPIYEAWELISADQLNYSCILQFSDGIVFSRGEKNTTNTLLYLNDNNIQTLWSVNNFQKMSVATGRLVVTSNNTIQIYDASFALKASFGNPVIAEVQQTAAFRGATLAANGELWAADIIHGLLRKREGNVWVKYLPQGPVSNHAFQLKFSGENLWLIPGGLDATWNNARIDPSISILSGNEWQHLTNQNSPLLQGSRDLLSITPHPENPDYLYVSSWGSGLFEVTAPENNPAVVKHHLTPENGLINIFDNNSRYVRVAATAFDKNKTLWMTNSLVANAIVAYFPHEDKWQRYSYGAISGNMGMAPILAASTGDMWLSIFRGDSKGLFIWNDNNTPLTQSDDIYRSVVKQTADSDNRNQGQLLMWDEDGLEITNSIYALVEDQNGHIWLGTDKGVVVQYQPFSIFTSEKPVFSRIIIAREDGTSLADYLLDGQIVSSILVDPSNRKWLGTQGEGIYLVSPDGSKQINAFNSNNSPLPSNYINSITMNEKTGEIFIATGEGVVSYKGSATKGKLNYSELYTFPNPVRPDFSGNITITGLVAQTTVKITDVSGKLVYETTSVGGQAFWDGRNLWGEAVKSGIYLVFVASEDGSQSAVTKIAIIR
jgi:hypothetical protein